ncbi:hypothetical protein [Pseudonocardia sp. D17]|uniref:hypothetical protein n=1 Tax=Pseudonocardia sp. D17 TaxID=882661 RepID=UPI0030CA8BFF
MIVERSRQPTGRRSVAVRPETQTIEEGSPLLDDSCDHLGLTLDDLVVSIAPESRCNHFRRQIGKNLPPDIVVADVVVVTTDDVANFVQNNVFLMRCRCIALVEDQVFLVGPNPQAESTRDRERVWHEKDRPATLVGQSFTENGHV